MKLQSHNKKKKIITAAIIAAVVIALIVIGVVIAIVASSSQEQEDPKTVEISEIRLSSYPDKVVYFVGDEFDPKGTQIAVINTESQVYYINDMDPDLVITGFDSSAPNDKLPLTITYKGHSITINVTVKETPGDKPYLVSIRVSDNLKTKYSVASWQSGLKITDDVKLICTYSDGSVKEVNMDINFCEGVDYNVTTPGTQIITVRYSDDGSVWAETTVTVTITN